MNYAKVEDGVITTVGLPEVGVLPDGRMVSGFDKLDPETLTQAGWLPIEDSDPPEYNSQTHILGQTLSIQNDKIITLYELNEIPVPEPIPEPTPPVDPASKSIVDELLATLHSKGILSQDDLDGITASE